MNSLFMENRAPAFRLTAVLLTSIWLLLALSAACHGVRTDYGSHDSGSGDSDSDADTDTDSDADSETETVDTDFPSDAIPTTCAEAAENPTSVGCEFFMADLDIAGGYNADLEPFAVIVSNPQEDQEAHFSIRDGSDNEIYTMTLFPGALDVIEVACDSGCLVPPHQIDIQGLSRGAGFRLVSDIPTLAYQWNPYNAPDVASTDASLLLPTTSLGKEYIVAARGKSVEPEDHPDWAELVSQLTVVATEDDTHVSFIPTVDVPEMGDAGPYEAGSESTPMALDAYDVITLTPANIDDDITGTLVRADRPVAVFGGHSCAMVPDGDYGACDHLEEQLPPLSAWGTASVLARYAPRHNCESEDLALWRIIAGTDGMTVTFDPPAPDPAGASYHFASRGEVLEFLAPGDYYAAGTLDIPEDPEHPEAPFLAYQLMTGSSFPNCTMEPYGGREGDPFMLLSPPAGQYLDRYVFNTATGFDFYFDHIIVVRPSGAHVVVDCLGLIPDAAFTEVGSSGFEAARIYIDDAYELTGCVDGAHLLTASAPVGLSVVGTTKDNSYGYLGGIGLEPINPVVDVE